MSEAAQEYTRERVGDWLMRIGVFIRADHTFSVAPKENDGTFWIMGCTTEFADNAAAAIRRAGGEAWVVVQPYWSMVHADIYADDVAIRDRGDSIQDLLL